MRISSIDPAALSREQITRLLFRGATQNEACGDCIFVFGSARMPVERVTAGARLYHAGKAPHILFTGGSPKGTPQPEALIMRELAVAQGVPASSILVETESNNTKENVLASLLVLDRAIGLHNIQRLLVVSAPYHMRRCLLTLRTYMPRWVEYAWHPDGRTVGRADNWWERPDTAERIHREVRNLVAYVRAGQLLDEDISL